MRVHWDGEAAQVQAEMVAGGYSWAEAKALVLKLFRMSKKARVWAKALAGEHTWRHTMEQYYY